MHIPELLAPAGSPEALKAAVYAGCDAVYLGGRLYGARAYAANFDNAGIEKAVAFAHEHGVKVYVTVNTLIRDADMQQAAEYLQFLSAADVDAVLVQDAGLAALAREIVPDLPLHASTQMTITNPRRCRRTRPRWCRTWSWNRNICPRSTLLLLLRTVPLLLCCRRQERKPGNVRPAMQKTLYSPCRW